MSSHLTEAETSIYDRQIRLWGMAAQERLRRAHVLFVGMELLNSDVAKNIVLAGVGTVTVATNIDVSLEHIGHHLLVRPGDVGKKLAHVSVHNLCELNPMVSINALDKSPDDLLDMDIEWWSQYEVIIVEACSIDVAVKLNQRAREISACFLFGRIHGFIGRVFIDVGVDYKYVTESIQAENRDSGRKRKAVIEIDSTPATTEATISSPSLSDTLAVKSLPKRVRDIFETFETADWFLTKHGRWPQMSDIDALLTHLNRTDVFKYLEQLCRSAGVEIVAVAGIVGGVVAGEIVKMVTRKGVPLRNFFFFDAMQGGGTVDFIS